MRYTKTNRFKDHPMNGSIGETLVAVRARVGAWRTNQPRPGVLDATAQSGQHQTTKNEQHAVFDVFH
jgi:hypothetical protein